MNRILSKKSLHGLIAIVFLCSCQKNIDHPQEKVDELSQKSASKALRNFEQVNLVGDNNEYNPAHIDPSLINAWGLTFPASGPAWVSSQGGAVGEIYNSDGTAARAAVTIPSLTETSGGHPTGIVLNNTQDFKLPNGNPARFIFAEAEGLISGWNGGNAAIKMTDAAFGNFYFGIALASVDGNSFLYAANFSQNRIDVYDKNWVKVEKQFVDPDLREGYSPFNIQNIDGRLYVMYAKHGTKEGEIVASSPGNGFIDVFNPNGSFVKRLISAGQLNAPWGITKAPAGFFGEATSRQPIILVGNFGDGYINAYTSEGVFQGQLRTHDRPIQIERLWGIEFAPETSTTFDHNQLYFAAGPGKEQHGLFGFIKKSAISQ